MGVRNMQLERDAVIIESRAVSDTDEIIAMTADGIVIRIRSASSGSSAGAPKVSGSCVLMIRTVSWVWQLSSPNLMWWRNLRVQNRRIIREMEMKLGLKKVLELRPDF